MKNEQKNKCRWIVTMKMYLRVDENFEYIFFLKLKKNVMKQLFPGKKGWNTETTTQKKEGELNKGDKTQVDKAQERSEWERKKNAIVDMKNWNQGKGKNAVWNTGKWGKDTKWIVNTDKKCSERNL